MAPPTDFNQDMIIIVSDDEEEGQIVTKGPISMIQLSEQPFMMEEGRMLQVVPRSVSPMLHNVQQWDVDNQTLYKTGQQIEPKDKSGLETRGMLYGETDVGGQAGRAQGRLEFWQPGANVRQSGWSSAHTQGVYKEQSLSLQLGQSGGYQKVSVGVRAPSRHCFEEKVRSGATHLTSRAPLGSECQMILEEPSTSPDTGFIAENYELQDEVLDYEADEPEDGEIVQHGEVQNYGCKRLGFNGVRRFGVLQEPAEKAVQSDRQDGMRKKTVTAVYLPRGENRRAGLEKKGNGSRVTG
ncbi:hypothetical protein NDU88_004734 [Pleurodeles waltl]|uniref:Uncharacterized protein n=1 Tax=Pleurodeles waltl TaxID=8319 RepID=A0AAV7MHF4_PLEWA|nr:hypothetical protein NDU88_004734 [Pleurodeles waltl]